MYRDSVRVLVVRVREVCVGVRHWSVTVNMTVPGSRLDRVVVFMIVVQIPRSVKVFVGMFERSVRVLVRMLLREMQPDSYRH